MRALLLSLTLLVAIMPAVTHAQTPSKDPDPDVIVTSGEAIIKRAPDQAFVTMTVEARARVPAEAQKATALAMANVQKALKAAGFGADTVRTLVYDLQPEYDYANGKQTLRAYVARTSIEVRVEPVERAGEVIDLSVQSGATSVSSLRFDVKARETVEREALTQAVQAARARADAAAAGAGRTVDRLLRIEDQGAAEAPPPRPYGVAMRMAAADAAQTPVQAGEVEIRARVTLTAKMR